MNSMKTLRRTKLTKFRLGAEIFCPPKILSAEILSDKVSSSWALVISASMTRLLGRGRMRIFFVGDGCHGMVYGAVGVVAGLKLSDGSFRLNFCPVYVLSECLKFLHWIPIHQCWMD